MKAKKILVLLTSAVMTLGTFSGCSLGSNKAKDLSVNMWGKPLEQSDYVLAVKKAVEKQGYQVEMDDYGDDMYKLNCYKDEFLNGVDISFYDGEIEEIIYTYEVNDAEAIDSNIQDFQNHVIEYSEMLDKVSKNTSLELWPVSEVLSDPVYYEMYRENPDKSTYVCNGCYDFSFFVDDYTTSMYLWLIPDQSTEGFSKGFYDSDEESTDTSDNDSDSDDSTNTVNGKAESYDAFKEKMYEIFDEGYGTDSMSLQDEFNVLTVYSVDKPNNRIVFDVANDGTINSVSYEYEIASEISDDTLVEETNNFISDITAKALESGYNIPLLTSDLDESVFENYFSDKSKSYELVLEDGKVEFKYYAKSAEQTYSVFSVKVINA